MSWLETGSARRSTGRGGTVARAAIIGLAVGLGLRLTAPATLHGQVKADQDWVGERVVWKSKISPLKTIDNRDVPRSGTRRSTFTASSELVRGSGSGSRPKGTAPAAGGRPPNSSPSTRRSTSSPQRFAPIRRMGSGTSCGPRVLRDKDEFERAVDDYDEAIQLNPRDALAYEGRGEMRLTQLDYDRAIADYTQGDPARAERRLRPLRPQSRLGSLRVSMTEPFSISTSSSAIPRRSERT